MANFLDWLKDYSPVAAWAALLMFLYRLCRDIYKKYFQGVKVNIFTGDTLYIVRSTNNKVRKIHLTCNFVNNSSKLAIIHKVIVRATSQDSKEQGVFPWNIFYKYAEADREAEYQSETFPIAVPPYENVFQGIEFSLPQDDGFRWKAGKFDITVSAWVNQKCLDYKPRSDNHFSITLEEGVIDKLYGQLSMKKPASFPIPIDDWDLRLYTIEKGKLKGPSKFPKFVIK
jgi:hypothetical protein